MSEKETLILITALKIFIQKGFHATSVQEIANACHISKGAFYLHFKSKEQLLKKIFQLHYDARMQKLEQLANADLSAREKCLQLLIFELEETHEHREFIIMQKKEQAIPNNIEIADLIAKIYTATSRFFQDCIKEMYPQLSAHALDLTIIVMGIKNAYLHLILFTSFKKDWNELAYYLLDRLDDIAAGFMKRNNDPLLNECINLSFENYFNTNEKIAIIDELEAILSKREVAINFIPSIEILLEELHAVLPRPAIIKGMVANLSTAKELKSILVKLNHYLETLT